MPTAVLRRLDAVNRRHPWSHNAAWTPWVLRHARAVRRAGGTAALDIGCGTGELLRRLADVLPDVTGVESDPDTAAHARRAVADRPAARVTEGRFPDVLVGAATARIRHPRAVTTTPTWATSPVAPPETTFAEVRTAVRATFPGARVRRRLFWRYTATWVAPR